MYIYICVYISFKLAARKEEEKKIKNKETNGNCCEYKIHFSLTEIARYTFYHI